MTTGSFFQQYPLGDPINGSPHSVVVSLPTMADIIGYETKDPRVLGAMRSGYPRFFEHAFIGEIRRRWIEAGILPDGVSLFTATRDSLPALLAHCGVEPVDSGEEQGMGWIVLAPDQTAAIERARAFIQHTGTGPSSRQVEDLLVAGGWREQVTAETTVPATADAIVARLAPHFGVPEANLFLAQGGMNAFYAAFTAINQLLRPEGRRRWVQLGWLYVDTIKVLSALCEPGCEPIVWNDAFDLKGLARELRQRRSEIAGIITEAPTNPLIQTPDLVALRALADEIGCPLVLDPSVASVANVDVTPWADVVVVSLTKYAARFGDVLLGGVAVHPERRWARAVVDGIRQARVAPYSRDLHRLAAQLEGWEAFAREASVGCAAVAAYLEAHPKVDCVWWAGRGRASEGYRRIARDQNPRWGAVLSFTVKGSLARFYDAVGLAKGPSFGTAFSLMAPFVYLAHYELVTSAEGRAELESAGLHPELIRLSIGEEPVEDLIQRLDAALALA